MWDAVCKHIVLVDKHVHMCVSEVVSVSYTTLSATNIEP